LTEFVNAGIDVGALGVQLQDEGAKSFVKSWNELMNVIAAKSAVLAKAGQPNSPVREQTGTKGMRR
jgi:transaldolase